MTGAMGDQLLVPNRKKMIMDLVRSRLENIIKSKLIKKT